MEVMSTGKMTINENGLNFAIDFKVNKFKALKGWEDPTHDILGDIADMVQMALDKGYVVNTALTSTKMRSYMLKNEGIMKAIKGVNFVGMAITQAEVENLLFSLHSLNMVIDDDMYGIANKENTTRTPKRFYRIMYLLFMYLLETERLVLDFGA